jgi:hypothetical protein
MITKPKKELTPASIVSQKKWGSLPLNKKRDLRKILPDRDKDGVPNKFDCRPKNNRRQEQFLPVDRDYLRENPNIEIGEMIGEGNKGVVYSVKNNRNLVVKVAGEVGRGTRAIEREGDAYDEHDLNNEEFFIPTRRMNIASQHDHVGLVRPRLSIITDAQQTIPSRYANNLTNSQIEELRRKIIRLSHKGYAFVDGFQIGKDARGRLLLYDVDYLDKYDSGHPEPFKINQKFWKKFLNDIGKFDDWGDITDKYGKISQKERY